MQEEVESRSLTLAINTAKLTGRTLKNAISKLLAYRKNKKAAKAYVHPQGKQSVKKLIGQNQGGFDRDGPRDGAALLLAAGDLAGELVAVLPEAKRAQEVLHG